MTLAPQQIGDKGQRFEVHCVGYPNITDNVIGWSDDREKARELGHSILNAPSASIVYTIDRENQTVIDRSMSS